MLVETRKLVGCPSDLWPCELKIGTLVTPSKFTPIVVPFLFLFCLNYKPDLYRRHCETERLTDGQQPYCGLLGWQHNNTNSTKYATYRQCHENCANQSKKSQSQIVSSHHIRCICKVALADLYAGASNINNSSQIFILPCRNSHPSQQQGETLFSSLGVSRVSWDSKYVNVLSGLLPIALFQVPRMSQNRPYTLKELTALFRPYY